jgi:hypothetical protein
MPMTVSRACLLTVGLMIGLVLLTPVPVRASFQLGAQVTDLDKFQGIIAGRFHKDYEDVDLYVVLKKDEAVYSLYKPVTEAPYGWQSGVQLFSSYSVFSANGWGYVAPVDFSVAREDPAQVTLAVFLVKRGSDPLVPDNWMDHQEVGLITDPLERRPGQTIFLSQDSTYPPGGSGYPGTETPADTSAEGEDGANQEEDPGQSEPEKPDIFKVMGNKLYYANGSGGRLQLIDLNDPALPTLLASLPIDGIPQELYVDGTTCLFLEQEDGGEGPRIHLRTFQTSGGTRLEESSQLTLPLARYQISRRLGDRIYLVADGFQAVEDDCCDPIYPGESVVYCVDISNGQQPRLLAQQSLSGYDPNVYLDNRYLISIVRENWSSTTLHLYDLQSDGNPLAMKTTIRIPGQVPSEYHLQVSESFLYVVYMKNLRDGSVLSVYDLGRWYEPAEVGRIGSIAPGEELHATRFSGQRAYVVTYERQDPLWVIDLQDPTRPRILGELEVPGWSEYMEFHDDKLIALGYDDSQNKRLVSVALFSVENPRNPTLLHRLTPLADELSYTYTEAIDDERAFYVNYTNGIILFPLQHYNNCRQSGLVIVRLAVSGSTFSSHAYVPSDFHVLRGTEADSPGIVIGLGDAAINTIDMTSPTQPAVLGHLRLARNVEQAVQVDGQERLWTLGGDFSWCGAGELLVFNTDDLDSPLAEANTELSWPTLVMADRLGVVFSHYPAQFRAIDLETVTMGVTFDLEEEYGWGLESPLIFDSHFYLASGQYLYHPLPEETSSVPGESGLNNPSAASDSTETPSNTTTPYNEPLTQWTLKRFNCSNIDAPLVLPELSIPGRPLGFSEAGKLLSVEERFICPYCDYDGAVPEPYPVPEDGRSLRLNVLAILGDRAILEDTRLFEAEEFGLLQPIMDGRHVFLTTQEEEHTSVFIVDPNNLTELRRVTVDGSLVPVKVSKGRMVLASQPVYSYEPLPVDEVASADLAPYWQESGFSVYDFNGERPQLLLQRDGEYVHASKVAIGEQGVLLADGYRGIRFIPFQPQIPEAQ